MSASMTPEEQRIKIAEACGWTYWQSKHGHWHVTDPEGHSSEPAYGVDWPKFDPDTGKRNPSMPWWYNVDLPDYLKDLNAMHEAEKVLTPAQQLVYEKELARVVLNGNEPTEEGKINWYWMSTKYAHATAAQRAEAFLRCIGKWT